MIYTTYLSKLNLIPKGAVLIFIAKHASTSVQSSLEKYNCIWAPILGPSDNLRDKYKEDKDFYEFRTEYLSEQTQLCLKHDESRLAIFTFINYAIKDEVDVYLICYEKDHNVCHRSILANYLSDTFLTDWEEATYESKNS